MLHFPKVAAFLLGFSLFAGLAQASTAPSARLRLSCEGSAYIGDGIIRVWSQEEAGSTRWIVAETRDDGLVEYTDMTAEDFQKGIIPLEERNGSKRWVEKSVNSWGTNWYLNREDECTHGLSAIYCTEY